MTHLLRSALAKNAKEAAVQVPPLAPSRDTVKLKKHISLVSLLIGMASMQITACVACRRHAVPLDFAKTSCSPKASDDIVLSYRAE